MNQVKQYPFEFHGSGGEFFKIWLVNVLLTIATLGIYSAWAKVRTTRYFYGNTKLNDASFEYLASPLAILRGRIIAVIAFVVYSVASGISPLLGSILLLLFFLATPFIIVQALRFHHGMSAYKNIRFSFNGSMGESAMVNLVWPVLSILSFGLLYPIAHQRFVKFYVSNTRYGKAAFESSAMIGQFYKLYLILFAVGMAVAGGAYAVAYSVGVPFLKAMLSGNAPEAAGVYIIMAVYAVSLIFYLVVFAFMKSKVTNLIMNTMTVDGHVSFESNLSLRKVSWILISNGLSILLTFGLAYPWAKVRLARYRAENTDLMTAKSLDEFTGAPGHGSSAIGEEMDEVFDLGVTI